MLALLKSVAGHTRSLVIPVLGGREDGGRGYGPIRHGALSAIDSASAHAISLRAAGVWGVHAGLHAAMQGLGGCVGVGSHSAGACKLDRGAAAVAQEAARASPNFYQSDDTLAIRHCSTIA